MSRRRVTKPAKRSRGGRATSQVKRQPATATMLYLLIGLIAAATWAVYAQAPNSNFIGLDDPAYVIQNEKVKQGLSFEAVTWAFTATELSNWHPITWLSYMAETELFGTAPAVYHRSNLVIHIMNSLLLLLAFREMTNMLWLSALVSALFALHPFHVESVAWVAERKDVLSGFFWILTMILYSRYVKAPTKWRYGAVWITFGLGLMAKPMLVTLPAVLLLLDYWPLCRAQEQQREESFQGCPSGRASRAVKTWPQLIVEKLPFLLLSLLSSAITLFAQHKGKALITTKSIPLDLRVKNALVAYATYIGKAVWPHSLAVYYPYPATIPVWQAASAGLLLAVLSALAIAVRHRYPYCTVGWLWFVGTLVPVIGLVQVGEQAMADRYTYIPLIGLFIAFAWGMGDLAWRGKVARWLVSIAVSLAVLALSAKARTQVGYWKDTSTLFSHTLEVTSENSMAHTVLANELLRQGQLEEAVNHYRKALAIDPGYARAHNNLAAALIQLGRLDEAIEQSKRAVELDPEHAGWHVSLAQALYRKGHLYEAIRSYQNALKLDAGNTKALNGLGVALLDKGELEGASTLFSKALRIRPAFAEAQYNLGLARALQNRPEQAAEHFKKALALGLRDADTHYQLAEALRQSGKLSQALQHYRETLRLDPSHTAAKEALATERGPERGRIFP